MPTTKSLKVDAVWKKLILVIAGAGCVFASYSFSKWGMASSGAVRAEDADVAEFLTTLAPDDPQTHYSAAVLLEKSFEPSDISKSLNHLEIATGLAPENYLYWLDLGRARERSGDSAGAERALRRALELAPNYAHVQWTLGNNLLRQGRVEEAFEQIKKAVAGNPTSFAGPATVAAWQFFDADLDRVRRVMDGSVQFDGALTALLIREKRFVDALDIWNRLPTEQRRQTPLRETGQLLINSLLAEKRFKQALDVEAGLREGGDAAKLGQVTNGGFESAVKPAGAGPFEWQIAPGLQPQIVLNNGQKHGGNNSLAVVFNSNDGKEFRSVSQLIAVQPNAGYELEIFYRSDIKTTAVFKWEIADAGNGRRLAVSDAISNRAEWTPFRLSFRTASDGVIVRVIRENCDQICPTSGNIGFDDITLRSVGGR